MKITSSRLVFLLCPAFALALSPHACAAASPKPSVCVPARLRCEYLVDPVGIDATQPRLDWILETSGSAPRNLRQAAMQILVASKPDLLAAGKGDLWDSARQATSQSSQIAYKGKALTSREICYWKVRVWDSLGHVSAWSPPATWEMGLLNAADWKAQWIEATPPAGFTGEYAPVPLLRRDFNVTASPVAKARLYVTALGLYEMHLNGERVGDHVFAPDFTDSKQRLRYQVYDVTSLVHPGANALGALLGNGWYSGHIGNGGFQVWGKTPALFAQLEVTHQDGTTETILSDDAWKTHPSPVTSSDFMLGENYDAREEIADWDKAGLDVTNWTSATVRPEAARKMDAQADQPVRELSQIHPIGMTQPAPGKYVFDLGQNMVGYVQLQVTGSAGTKITIRHAEMLNPDGTIYTDNLRGAPSIDTYICKGTGAAETWHPRFTFHGFRYVELSGMPQAPEKSAVTGIVIGTDIPHTGDFACSDSRINQLQSNIQWGMRGNYLSIPTDCPQRDERLGWMGDAQIFIRTASYNGDVSAFFTKWLVDVDDAQDPTGKFTDVSPAPDDKSGRHGGIPAWGDAGVICPWTIYLMYGDKRILTQDLPAMKRWVDWCTSTSAGNLRETGHEKDYGDWLSQAETTSKGLIASAYYAYSTSLLAKAYAAVGDTKSANTYSQLFDQIKQAFIKRYVSADGHIEGGTQSSYCMALRFNLLPDNLRSKAGDYLAQDVYAHENHLTTGFIGVGYLLPSLTSVGQIETAYRVFLQDTFPSWLFSVKHGATTVWERWDGWTPEKGFQTPKMNSFNHYSLGSCGEWMFDTVAGIDLDPASPGFSHFLIHPQPGTGITSAHASFDSIHGKIVSDWKAAGNQFTLNATVPVNTTATITLPAAIAASIKEGGMPIAKHPEIKAVHSAGDVSYLVGSGNYVFTCTSAWLGSQNH